MNSTELKLIRLLTYEDATNSMNIWPADGVRKVSFESLWQAVKKYGETRQCVRLILDDWASGDIPYAVKLDNDSYSLVV